VDIKGLDKDLQVIVDGVEAAPMRIDTQEQYGQAEIYLRDSKAAVREIKARFKPIRDGEKASRKLQKDLESPFVEGARNAKAMMEEYLMLQVKRIDKVIDKAEGLIDDEAKAERGKELQELVAEGRTDEALELSSQPIKVEIELPMGEVRPTTGKASSARMSWKYSVVDERKIRDKYMTPPIAPAPDRISILRTVRKMGKDAEGEIGEGSIKVERDLTVASLSERKAIR